MKMVVGCPVYERAWVLPRWFRALESWPVDHFIFCYTPSQDDTLDIIKDVAHRRNVGLSVLYQHEGTHGTTRDWANEDRITTLALMRNRLLDKARDLEADAYFSLDSDILASPRSPLFVEHLFQFDAVAPVVYLTEHGPTINAFTWPNVRKPKRRIMTVPDGIVPVDIICAAKLMGSRILKDEQVKYQYMSGGEDYAWSLIARQRGYTLGLDGKTRFKHVMSADWLETRDERIGW